MNVSFQMRDLIHHGPWRRLINTVPAQGSIHDDAPARELGFKGAFVPGSVVSSAAMPAVIERFGPAWLEGGWFDFTFVSPVYVSEDVREEACWHADSQWLELRVVTRDDRLCMSGRAGVGDRLPWEPGLDGSHDAENTFPELSLTFAFEPREFVIRLSDVLPMLEGSGDATPCYRETSPFGEPVAPPIRLMRLALDATRGYKLPIEGVKQPGMWAEHALAVKAPIRYDTPYTLCERVADKGRSGRTAYLVYEFRLIEPTGDDVAVGRHKVKWLATSS